MSTIDETIKSLQQDLIDAEADIQAALYSMRSKVTSVKIVTHQRRDRPDENGRPGFFRQELDIARHIETVQTRADMEHTTAGLNHKNWGSVINALLEISSGCVEDGNKIALRVDSLKSALRTMHLLQQHLAATAKTLPALPDKKPEPTQAQDPVIEPVTDLGFNVSTTVPAGGPEYSLAEINFATEEELAQAGDDDPEPDQPNNSMSEPITDEDDDDPED